MSDHSWCCTIHQRPKDTVLGCHLLEYASEVQITMTVICISKKYVLSPRSKVRHDSVDYSVFSELQNYTVQARRKMHACIPTSRSNRNMSNPNSILSRDKSHKRLLLKHLEHIPVVFASSMLAVLHWLNSVSKTAVQTDSVFQNQ